MIPSVVVSRKSYYLFRTCLNVQFISCDHEKFPLSNCSDVMASLCILFNRCISLSISKTVFDKYVVKKAFQLGKPPKNKSLYSPPHLGLEAVETLGNKKKTFLKKVLFSLVARPLSLPLLSDRAPRKEFFLYPKILLPEV